MTDRSITSRASGTPESGFVMEIHDGDRSVTHVGTYASEGAALDAVVTEWNKGRPEGEEELKTSDLRPSFAKPAKGTR